MKALITSVCSKRGPLVIRTAKKMLTAKKLNKLEEVQLSFKMSCVITDFML